MGALREVSSEECSPTHALGLQVLQLVCRAGVWLSQEGRSDSSS